MTRLSINRNKQAQTTLPKEIIEALGWENGDSLLVSKSPGQDYLVIENVKVRKVKQ